PVCPPRVNPKMKPRAPPRIAPSSTNEPSRAVNDATRSGPARTARAYPTSAASTCHPPPRVPAKPTVHAPRRWASSGVDKATRAVDIVMMDRRTFVLLTGATSGALLRPRFQPSTAPTRARGRSGGPAVGRLKFELDEQRRWSLWYYGDGQPVPLIQTAVVGARVGDSWSRSPIWKIARWETAGRPG